MMLQALQQRAPEVADAVARLCSAWWQAELPGRDCLVPQMVPYLLYQAVTSGEGGRLGDKWLLLLAGAPGPYQVLPSRALMKPSSHAIGGALLALPEV